MARTGERKEIGRNTGLESNLGLKWPAVRSDHVAQGFIHLDPRKKKSAEVLFQFRDPKKVAELESREDHLQESIKPKRFQDYDFNCLTLLICILLISSAA